MAERGYRTVDELSHDLRQHDDGLLVLQAKGIMTALLLDLERTADLSVYRRAVRTMIDANDLALPPEGTASRRTRSIDFAS